ncbi:MAG: xanthine dehydrogenase family protein molybdopterin-binding subunit, partial [Gammaproteobacteria bacterium]
MTFSPGRRRFLVAAGVLGGGLLIGYGLFRERDLLGSPDVLPVGADEIALNAWLKIDRDGHVTVAVPRAEMGQGVYTALPMLVAEELGAAWADVRVEQAPIDKVYGNIAVMTDAVPLDPHDSGLVATTVRWTLARVGRMLAVQVTGGSTSVRDAWLPMRAAGAAARDMLVRAAAARFDVPAAELAVADGRVTHAGSGRALAFGALAEEAAALAPPTRFD